MSSSSWWGQCCHTTRTAAYAPVQVSVFRIRPTLAMSWRGHSIPSVNAVTWYMVFFELQLSSMPASRLHLTKETSVRGLIHETSGCAFYSILVLIACLLAYLGFAKEVPVWWCFSRTRRSTVFAQSHSQTSTSGFTVILLHSLVREYFHIIHLALLVLSLVLCLVHDITCQPVLTNSPHLLIQVSARGLL